MRALIIDDNVEIRRYLRSNLEREGFAVDTAPDGEEGSYLGRTREYDLVLLDSVLPGKQGRDVCRELRDAGKRFPIIALSVIESVDHKVELLERGADDYVAKPFSYPELRSRIRAVLRRPDAIIPPVLRVGDLELDSARQRVARGGSPIRLTRKEFALAEFLMRNEGVVLSRASLMEHVWNDDLDPFSNTVETHILNLRKKIDRGCDQKLIQTVAGRGYKIESQESVLR